MRKRFFSQIMHENKGFSLIELLTVAVILVIISTVIAGIITATLRGTSKSKITNIVSQNGTYAVSVMTGIVRSSTAVDKIIEEDGTEYNSPTTLTCTEDPKREGKSITLTRFDGDQTILSCIRASGGGIQNYIASTSASTGEEVSLTDNTSVEVDFDSCYFTCRRSGSVGNTFSPPLVEVGFTLKQPGADASHIDSVSVPFSTQILMRNFTP